MIFLSGKTSVDPPAETGKYPVFEELLRRERPLAWRRLRYLREREGREQVQVRFAGTFSAGKSSLLNRLLEREYLPVAATPTTASALRLTAWPAPKGYRAKFKALRERVTRRLIARGPQETKRWELLAVYPDGRRESVNMKPATTGVAEDANKGRETENKTETLRVSLEDPNGNRAPLYRELRLSPFPWNDRVCLIDAPGQNSALAAHGDFETRRDLKPDILVYALNAGQPLSEGDARELEELARPARSVFVLLNKIDNLDPLEDPTEEVLRFTEEQIRRRGKLKHFYLYPTRGRIRGDCSEDQFDQFRARLNLVLEKSAGFILQQKKERWQYRYRQVLARHRDFLTEAYRREMERRLPTRRLVRFFRQIFSQLEPVGQMLKAILFRGTSRRGEKGKKGPKRTPLGARIVLPVLGLVWVAILAQPFLLTLFPREVVVNPVPVKALVDYQASMYRLFLSDDQYAQLGEWLARRTQATGGSGANGEVPRAGGKTIPLEGTKNAETPALAGRALNPARFYLPVELTRDWNRFYESVHQWLRASVTKATPVPETKMGLYFWILAGPVCLLFVRGFIFFQAGRILGRTTLLFYRLAALALFIGAAWHWESGFTRGVGPIALVFQAVTMAFFGLVALGCRRQPPLSRMEG